MSTKPPSRIDTIFDQTGAYTKFPALERGRKFKGSDKLNRSKSQSRQGVEEKTQEAAKNGLKQVVQFSNNNSNSSLLKRRPTKSNQQMKIRPGGTQSQPGSKNPSPASSDNESSPSFKSKIPVHTSRQGSFTPNQTHKRVQSPDQGSESRELTIVQKIETGIALGNNDLVMRNLIVREISKEEMNTIIHDCATRHNFTLLKLIYDQVSGSFPNIHFPTASLALANHIHKGALQVLESAFKNLTPTDASKMLVSVLKSRSKSQLEKFITKANLGSKEVRDAINLEFKNALAEAVKSEYAFGLETLLSKDLYPPADIDPHLAESRNPEIAQLLAKYASEQGCLKALESVEKNSQLERAIREGMAENPQIPKEPYGVQELSQIEEVSEVRPASVAPTEISRAPTPAPEAPPTETPVFSPRQDKKDPLTEE